MRTTKRILVVLLAYYLACLSAVNTAIILRFFRDTFNGSRGERELELLWSLALSFPGAIIFGMAAGIQSLILIALGGAMNLRSALYYCLGGASCGLVLNLMSKGKSIFPPLPPLSPGILDNEELMMLISGFVAGFVYWAIAVRRRQVSGG